MIKSPLQAVTYIADHLPVTYVYASESLYDGSAYQVVASSGFGDGSPYRGGEIISGDSVQAMSLLQSKGRVVFNEDNYVERDLASRLVGGLEVRSGVSVPISVARNHAGLLVVYCDKTHSFSQVEIGLIEVMAGVISEFFRKTGITGLITQKTRDIANAKREWESTIDALPQLIIALDAEATIMRVNRTAEEWGGVSVSMARGMDIASFAQRFRDGKYASLITSDWSSIWARLPGEGNVEWVVDEPGMGKVLQYSLRRIVVQGDYEEGLCYAVLVIEDVSNRRGAEITLKRHIWDLEKEASESDLQLKEINERLQLELLINRHDKQELLESKSKLKEISSRLIDAQETQRKRIASELHDSIGQSLGAVKFKLEGALGGALSYEMQNLIKGVAVHIKSIIGEVRRIAMDLRPSMLDDLGVLQTLNWFFRGFEGTYTRITVNRAIEVEEEDIDAEKKIAIYRIVQEAMNNVAKHANATRVDFELNKQSGNIRLCIRDNGCGYNRQEINDSAGRRGFGLNSMLERSESIGGRFEVGSIPGEGTSVQVIWPAREAPCDTVSLLNVTSGTNAG